MNGQPGMTATPAAGSTGSEEFDLRVVFDNAPDIVMRFDPTGRYLYVNRAVERASWCRREQFPGRTNEELGMPAAQRAVWREALERAVSSKTPQRFEFDFTGPDLTRTYQTWMTPEFDAAGSVCSVLAVSRDITELRRDSETAVHVATEDLERQRLAIFTETRDAMVIVDGDRRIFDANPAACELLGVSREALLPHRLDDFFGGETPAEVDEIWRTFLAAKRLDGEFPLRRHDGTSRMVEIRAIADFVPGRHLAVARDITERIRMQQETERAGAEALARARAEAASRAKDEFIAMLGHELRNPLAPITMALQLMELHGDKQVERERRVIERQVRHLTRLVDDLLDISRITRGQVVLEREPVEISTILAKALEMAGPVVEQRAHHLDVNVAEGHLVVDGDPVRLAQVVANLLTNAAKYTDPEGHILVTAGREGGEIVLSVRDDGAGIPEDLLPNVFDLFVQGRRTLDRSQGGLGIGLSLVRQLVTLHGGIVSVKSEVGKGSEFTVRLPARDALEAASVRVVPEGPAQGPGVAPARERKRVLIVDDSIDAAVALAEVLGDFGYVTRVAHDGVTALREAGEFLPQVVLLDIGLPRMDGFELAQRLRQEAGLSGAQIIAVTGYGTDSDRARSRAAGIDAHLVKPIDTDRLRRLMEQPDNVRSDARIAIP